MGEYPFGTTLILLRTAPGKFRTTPGELRTTPKKPRTAPGKLRITPKKPRTAPKKPQMSPGNPRIRPGNVHSLPENRSMHSYQILIPPANTPCYTFAPIMNNRLSPPLSRPIAIWLLIGVCMLIVQIILGGITRLSGSGLSITEWNVITGALPPLSEQQWLAEFDKYKQTPQFHLLNFDFTLKDFKFIFFWEWLHRFWARFMGVVFIVPFVIFVIQRRFKQSMIRPMIILFLLGALQGAVGWIMVASGLTGDAIYVAPAKLALHFVFALVLLCYTFWFALQLSVPNEKIIINAPLRKLTWTILAFIFLQLIYGALMAGNKAATAAPTWPDINGSFIPPHMFTSSDVYLNLLGNKITIHFIHRSLAYLIFILIIVWTIRAYKISASSLFNKIKPLPLIIVCLQILLGILSVIMSVHIVPNRWGVFEWMAQCHQVTGILLLLSIVWMLYVVRNKGIRNI